MSQATPRLASIAGVVQRLSVLLAAGTAPVAAWRYLDAAGLPASVVSSIDAGGSIPDAIAMAASTLGAMERVLWGAVAAAWTVAAEAGAPLSPTLDELAAAIRDLVQTQREVAVALASPRATARLVLILPGVGVLFGALLGFNTIGTLVTTPIGWTCIAIGAALLLVASRWNRRMVRRAEPKNVLPGFPLDLLAIALSGGGAMDRAQTVAEDALRRYVGVGEGNDSAVQEVFGLSRRAGVPAAGLLRSEATELRRAARSEAAEQAQALSVRLMIPLGVCVLPAFMVLSVVPLIVAVLSSTSLRL